MIRPQLKFSKLDSHALLPEYQSEGASGFDFHALEKVILKNGEVSLVRTGLAVEIPAGFELQVRARSGLAAKHGVFLVNGVGTIDADYRGEIKIILSTCKNADVILQAGDRIAQGVLAPVFQAVIVEANQLSSTSRGVGGFGSTDSTRPS